MTYLATEQSIEDGSPRELFEVRYDAKVWYYTSGDTSFFDSVSNNLYEPLTITRGNIIATSDSSRGSLSLEVDRGAEFLELFRTVTPSSVVALIVKRVHFADGDLQVVPAWIGRILNVSWLANKAVLSCESVRASMLQYGLRRQFQRQCPHVLYGTACGVSKALYQVDADAGALGGNQITAAALGAFPDDYFRGGMIEWLHDTLGVTERRSISASQTGTGMLTIIGAPSGLVLGADVRAYPGCDHTLGVNGCQRFSNTENFGGFPYTPDAEVFGGDPLF